MGNVVRGVPLNAEMEFTGNFFTLLNPFSLLVGLTGLAMFMTQGAAFLLVKTEGDVAARARRWAGIAWTALAVLVVATTIVAIVDIPDRFDNYLMNPVAWVVPLLAVLFLILTRVNLNLSKPGKALLFSSLTITGLIGILGTANFPHLLQASNLAEYGLTVYNASASEKSLTAMLIIVIIGMPLVIAYTVYVHRIFRGKVRLEEEGY